MSLEDSRLNKIRHALFNATASRYNQLIMPAFGPLAEELVVVAALQPEDRLLDLGTGTGAVAFPAGATARQVVGVDYASAMLPVAHRQQVEAGLDEIAFYQGDMHRLPHPTATFSVAIASFGFNGVDPHRTLPEVLRVLQPGGRLVFQEWGEVEEASRIVKQAVKRRQVADAEGFLADLRLLGATPRPWELLGDAGHIAQFLREVGFQHVEIIIERTAIPFDPHAFFHYKTAWAPYQAELSAMSEADRLAVKEEVLAQFQPWIQPDGRFIWQPQLMRMIASKG